jgi:hypothetical protein
VERWHPATDESSLHFGSPPAEMVDMRRLCWSCSLLTLWLCALLTANSGSQGSAGEGSILAFARNASIRALTFRQGDRDALAAARGTFTPEAWTTFMKDLEGWLDQGGAPTFGSSFVPSGDGRIVDEENGVVHVRVPGTLAHTQNQSRTTYRAAVDVWVGGNPIRIHKLNQTTCAGASRTCN